MDIRAAHPDEAETLTRIAHASKRHWGYSDELIALWEDDLTVRPEFVASHDVQCAVGDDGIVGFYALSHQGDVFDLEHMWVDPASIGRGIGTRLFEHALGTVRAHGGVTLAIASDPNAEGFYRKMGARRVGTVPSTPAGRTLPLLSVTLE